MAISVVRRSVAIRKPRHPIVNTAHPLARHLAYGILLNPRSGRATGPTVGYRAPAVLDLGASGTAPKATDRGLYAGSGTNYQMDFKDREGGSARLLDISDPTRWTVYARMFNVSSSAYATIIGNQPAFGGIWYRGGVYLHLSNSASTGSWTWNAPRTGTFSFAISFDVNNWDLYYDGDYDQNVGFGATMDMGWSSIFFSAGGTPSMGIESIYVLDRPLQADEVRALDRDPYALVTPEPLRKPLMAPFYVAASSFNPSWARGSNVVLHPGI